MLASVCVSRQARLDPQSGHGKGHWLPRHRRGAALDDATLNGQARRARSKPRGALGSLCGRIACLRAPGEEVVNRVSQRVGWAGLDQHAIEARGAGELHVAFTGGAGDRNHRDGSGRFDHLQATAQLEAVQAGHVEVGHHDVRRRDTACVSAVVPSPTLATRKPAHCRPAAYISRESQSSSTSSTSGCATVDGAWDDRRIQHALRLAVYE